MTAIELIAAERQRQVEAEGWTPEHDDEHSRGELTDAAVAYVLAADAFRLYRQDTMAHLEAMEQARTLWPWLLASWKPSADPIRNLVKAAALIAAEIDRRKRAEVDK